MLGKSAGTHFHKKFLLKKQPKEDSSAIPLDLSIQSHVEEVNISETFIDFSSPEGSVISCSVEKKGSHHSFTYTHKMTVLKNGQKILKKKNISASEYISYKSQCKTGYLTLKSKRLCIIDNGIYIIVDYYNERDGKPMIAIIQTKSKEEQNVDLPDYIKIHREITDEPQYLPEIMSKEEYY